MTRGCPALFLPPSGPKLHACFFLFSFVLFIFVFGFPLFSLFFIFVQKKNQKSKDETKFNERFSKNKNREKKDQTMCVSSTYFLGQLVCCMFLYSLLVLNMNTKPRKAKPSPPPEQERTTEGGGGISTQATPTTLGLNIHIRKSPEKKKKRKIEGYFGFVLVSIPWNNSAVLQYCAYSSPSVCPRMQASKNLQFTAVGARGRDRECVYNS